jgi:hypothetical protein
MIFRGRLARSHREADQWFKAPASKGRHARSDRRFEKYLSLAPPDDANVARVRQMLEALGRAAKPDALR